MFAASATVTLLACRSMSRAHEMAMPGWTMSMVWMRMPGETWLAGGLGFLWMWVVMMVAMMLPSLVRMLWRYSEAADGGQAVGGWRTAMMAAAYFLVWTLAGAAVYPLGAAMSRLAMRVPAVARAEPVAAALAVLLAGAVQFMRWKLDHLRWCQRSSRHELDCWGDGRITFRLGVHLGVHCVLCCTNLMLILLVLGIMDVRAMAVVTAAITAERSSTRAAQVIGVLALAGGVFLMVKAAR
jgi:predicted metal-binding membrane protein